MILQSMRWYLAYALSYRDIEEMMAERGFSVDHSTINRWVIHYSPQLEAAFCRRLHFTLTLSINGRALRVPLHALVMRYHSKHLPIARHRPEADTQKVAKITGVKM